MSEKSWWCCLNLFSSRYSSLPVQAFKTSASSILPNFKSTSCFYERLRQSFMQYFFLSLGCQVSNSFIKQLNFSFYFWLHVLEFSKDLALSIFDGSVNLLLFVNDHFLQSVKFALGLYLLLILLVREVFHQLFLGLAVLNENFESFDYANGNVQPVVWGYLRQRVFGLVKLRRGHPVLSLVTIFNKKRGCSRLTPGSLCLVHN